MTRHLLPLLCLSLSFPALINAVVTVELDDGTVYHDAEIRSIDADSVLLTHSGGIARVPLEKLNREIREKLGLKPTAATAKFDLDREIKTLESSVSSLFASYREKLQNLENEARANGDVDSVVEIRNEIASIPDLIPASDIESGNLLQLRKEHEENLNTESTQLAEKLGEVLKNHQEILERIADELTLSGKDVEASELRLEINEIASMAQDPGAALVELGIVSKFEDEREDEAAEPGHIPGRIVILAVTEAAKSGAAPRSFEAVMASDRSDIIGIGYTHFPNVAAILADGNLACWTDNSSVLQIIPGANVLCLQSDGLPVVALDRDGTLNFTKDAAPDVLSALEKQARVENMSGTYGLLALVLEDGSISTVGPRSDHEHAALLRNLENVKAVGFSGLGFVTVLKRDGTITKIRRGEASEQNGAGRIALLRSDGIGETESGTLVNLGGTPQTFLDEVGPKPRQIYKQNIFFCAISDDGTFHCLLKDKSGKLAPLDSIEKALKGAHDFAPIHGPDNAIWIAAILPSEEIGRSGLWKAEELISERN